MGPLRHIPVARLLVAAELLLLARRHLVRLEPQERRRMLELVRRGRLRRGRLTEGERRELAWLIQKTAPREFASSVTKRLVGVPLPGSGSRRGAGAKHD